MGCAVRDLYITLLDEEQADRGEFLKRRERSVFFPVASSRKESFGPVKTSFSTSALMTFFSAPLIST